MRKALLALIAIFVIVPVALAVMQDDRAPRMEITGLDPQELPTITVNVNVFDDLGQPVPNLTAADFAVTGAVADQAQIVSVTDISNADIPIAVVLAIDVSSSMAGTPIESARVAATSFVNAINPNDPVAVITFSSGVQLNQDFTTDRAILDEIINNLGFGGQTFLYDAALSAVEKAAGTDNPRRAVILLSDGAQYDTGPFSLTTRDEAIQTAVINGVPVYTIGLGFGADRTYLEALSASTNALFRESPTPDELDAIFAELAALLRTQYEVVIEVDVPLDGQVYDLDLEVTTPQGIAMATGRLRAPVPVPVVRLPEITEPIAELTEITAEIVADDALTDVEVMLDGASRITLSTEPYLYVLDPVVLTPGNHDLTFTATDEDGDSGSGILNFAVAALPSEVRFVPELGVEFAEQQLIVLEFSGQTPPVNVTLSRDGNEPEVLTEPFNFVIDPANIALGNHTVTVSVENAGGVTSQVEGSYSIPDIPPQFMITGLEAGQTLNGAVDVGVSIISTQAPIADITYAINGETISSDDGSARIDAFDLQPGVTTLAVTVTTELGQAMTNNLNFTVAALPPAFEVNGLEPGELLDADRMVVVENIVSQTPIVSVNAQVDGQALTVNDANEFLLEVVPLSPGDHILAVTVTNAGGQATTIDIPFAVATGPQQTATAQALPTNTSTTTPTDQPTATDTVQVSGTETAEAESTAAQQAADVAATAAQVGITETADVISALMEQTATSGAQAQQATADTAAQLAVTETAVVISEMMEQTVTAAAQAQQATADTQATTAQQGVTETAVVISEMMEQTVTAAVEDQQATADAQATTAQQGVTETAVVINEMMEQTATAAVEDQQATVNAQATTAQQAVTETAVVISEMMDQTATAAVEDQQATVNARATQAQQAVTETAVVISEMMQQTATADVEAAAIAQATANEQMTADAAATLAAENAQATTDAEATANAQTTADAAATLAAENAQATADAQAAQATVDAQNTVDAQAALERATENAQATTDADATENAQATIDAQATQDAEPTETNTSEPTETTTAVPTEVEPTEDGTLAAQVSTDAAATPTSAQEEGTPVPSITPIGTLIPAQAETTPSNESIVPLAVIIVIVVIILLLVFFILNRGRRQRS